MVQLSHPYMTTGKTTVLIRWTFVGEVMSLLFNILFRLVISFLPRSKCLLISWLQSPSAVILESKKITSVTVSNVFPPICHEMMGPDAMILVFSVLSFEPVSTLYKCIYIYIINIYIIYIVHHNVYIIYTSISTLYKLIFANTLAIKWTMDQQ